MRIGLIADIHSNLAALEAVLPAIKRHKPDLIVSLGDQVNLGPCPRETLALLRAEGVACLHGNHERYILSAMAGDPAYAGANFESLRFNASLLSAREITFPKLLTLEGVTLCHALPEDDRFPVSDPAIAMPRLQAMRLDKPLHVLCGHSHNPVRYSLPNLTLESVSSAGCMDDGPAGFAQYAILDARDGCFSLRPLCVPYDTRPLRGQFLRGGMADFCPVMAHIICLQMEKNFDYLLRFVTLAQAIARERGEERITLDTWHEADRRFDWPGGVATAAFWRAR